MSLVRTVLRGAPRLVSRNYYLKCGALLLVNALDALRYRVGFIATRSGTIHSSFDVQASVDYIRRVASDYQRYAGTDRFWGRVAEIGPGDSCGVGMLLLANGAESVDLVDRYYSERDPVQLAAVYARLREEVPELQRRFNDVDLLDERTFDGLARHYGAAASAETFFADHRPYAFIVSRAVMEHLYDPALAIAQMADALEPGGLLLHAVDFRDHGMFTPRYHELKFLSVPESVYFWMTRRSGRPNRVLIHQYRQALERSGLSFELLVTGLAGVGPIEPYVPYEQIDAATRARAEAYVESVRPSFTSCFRDVPTADLAVNGIFLVARKRATATS